MAKTISRFLESSVGPLRMRCVLTLLLCAANFFLAYGICIRYMIGGSAALFTVSLIATAALVLILAFPNLEVQDDAEAEDVVD